MTTAAERVDLDVSLLLLLLLLCILIWRQINNTFTVQERHSPIFGGKKSLVPLIILLKKDGRTNGQESDDDRGRARRPRRVAPPPPPPPLYSHMQTDQQDIYRSGTPLTHSPVIKNVQITSANQYL